MGDLKRGAKSTAKSIGKKLSQTYESMKEGSKQIGEFLGYDKVGAPQSDKTKQMLAEATPPVMPDVDEEELQRIRRRRAGTAQRSGRAATILSNDDDTLG